MNLQELLDYKKNNTFWFTESDAYLQSCFGFAHGCVKASKILPAFFDKLIFSTKEGHTYETQSVEDARKATEIYIREWIEDKSFLADLENGWKRADDEKNNIMQKMESLNLAELTTDELLNYYREILRISTDLWAYIGLTEAVGVYEEMNLPKKMEDEFGLSESQYTEIVIGFTQSEHKTFSKDYEASIGRIHDLVESSQNTDEEIEHIINGYYWIRTGYHGAPLLTREEILKEANLFRQSDEKYLSREKLIERYKIPDSALKIFDFIALMSFWRDERKRISLPLMFWTFKICDEIARRRSVAKELVYNLTDLEFYDFANGADIPRHTTKTGDMSFIIHASGIEIFRGSAHDKIFDTFFGGEFGSIESFSGTVAFKCDSVIKGKVRIVNNPIGVQLSKDEILVTAMTRPEFVLLMRQAAAVITDQGGLTSHAAIVARELKVPCIIGTKIATKVLHDGDYIELDTESGTINKL